jgi:hypothetical protein
VAQKTIVQVTDDLDGNPIANRRRPVGGLEHRLVGGLDYRILSIECGKDLLARIAL